MSRTLLAWSLVALVAMSTGCAMCAHPYDYCGPTMGPDQPCNPMARSGSILSPPLESTGYEGPVEMGQPTIAPEPIPTPQPTRAPTQTKLSAATKAPKLIHASASARALKPNRTSASARTSKPSSASAMARTSTRTTPTRSNPAAQKGADFFPDIPPENILSITDRRLDEVQGPTEEPAVSQQGPPKQTEPPQPTAKAQLVQSPPAAIQPQAKPTGVWIARDSGVVRP